MSGEIVGFEHALYQGDAVFQQKLALFQTAQQQLVRRWRGGELGDCQVEIAMLYGQLGKPDAQLLGVFF